MERVEEIRNHVKDEFEKSGQKWFVDLHLKIVEDLAMKLAKMKGADEEIVKLSVWLHDIYYSTRTSHQIGEEMPNDYDNHEIVGAETARKIMETYGYNDERIKLVENCILAHRCKGAKPESTEAKIVATADAMSHIDNFSMLLFCGFVILGKTVKEVHDWLYRKIERDWNDKIFFPEAKDMIRGKYEDVRLMLNEMDGK